MKQTGKCLIFSAPSGAGKTTIVRALLEKFEEISFSVSAASRAPRPNELNGVDYYFFSVEEFKNLIQENAFVEWEEVYKDHFYGTLKTEVERIWSEGKTVIFDVDVYGGINLKKFFGDQALSIFVMPPDLNALEQRLRNRSTETEDRIQTRLKKATEELQLHKQFDKIVVNDKLDVAIAEASRLAQDFIQP
jgi:guanylate kinase